MKIPIERESEQDLVICKNSIDYYYAMTHHMLVCPNPPFSSSVEGANLLLTCGKCGHSISYPITPIPQTYSEQIQRIEQFIEKYKKV